MFDKYKERYAKLEEDHESVRKIRLHFKANGKKYLIGGGIIVGTTVVGGGSFALGRLSPQFPEITQVAKNQALINWKPTVNQIALVKNECRPPQPILDKATGIPYPSMNEVARQTGEALGKIRADAHGAAMRYEKLPDSVFA